MERLRRTGRLLVLTSVLLAAPAFAGEEAVQEAGEVSWVSGGIGEDSRERLAALEAGFGFNLKVTFALASGDYLSDVGVRVVDAAGKTVLETRTEGPLMLLRLPPGRYDFHAAYGGRELRQKLTVAADRPGRTVFRWPAE